MLGIVLAVLAPPAVAIAGGELFTVKIREASVRSGPKPFRPIVATVKYGEKVEVVTPAKDGWLEVSAPGGKRGFLHESAVTDKEVTKAEGGAKGTGGKSSASSDEVALAGKGFNPQVEARYRADHKELEEAYRKVDAMEKRNVPGEELEAFLRDGQLGDSRRAR